MCFESTKWRGYELVTYRSTEFSAICVNIKCPRKFLVLSGATSKVSYLPLLFFLYLLLDYRWFVTFDNYLRKKRKIIIKIDGNWKFFCFYLTFFATFTTIFRILCWMTVVLSDYLKTKQLTPCWERRSLRTESNEAGCIGKAARRFRQRWEAGNDIERRLRRFV